MADRIDNVEVVFIPIIVVGELYYGASFPKQVKRNIDNAKKVITHYQVLTLDEGSTVAYGQIKSKLRKQGTPIPENDIWIVAIATQHNLVLITRDNHFKNISGLKIEEW